MPLPQPPLTARGERTRDALRQAAQVRFLAQGVEDTSAEQIAGDAGVTLRTFYRHFTSKHDLLFSDYDASLHWFRSALETRPAGETISEAVLAAIYSFPFDRSSMVQIAELRERELDRDQVDRHIQQVQAEFALEVERHLTRQGAPDDEDARFLSAVAAQCVAAATFAAVTTWMRGDHTDLEELARLTEEALGLLDRGLLSGSGRRSSRSVKIDTTRGRSLPSD
ncbi:MAG TPA: TetR/AcrR family transcriptional regulator [Acidimicrobiales bacterium]|jgi:AcrR family transcriptional regulator|nr:TetR/AcrR family transcriptional regulator [Acidimicrobiales bacterium]